MGQHLIRREKLGIPQSTRDVFSLLARGSWINIELADSLKRMVSFQSIAVHDYILATTYYRKNHRKASG